MATAGVGPMEALILLWLVSFAGAMVVAAMKGQWLWFVLGFVFVIPAYIGALLPARPGSAWERR